jgi:hypothetical protein
MKYSIKHCVCAIDVVMNLQFVNFIFLIGYSLRVLNIELNSTITASCAYIIDCTSYTDGTYSVSVVVGFDDAVGREKMAAKMVPARNMTDTQIFTVHWLKRHLRNQGICNIRTLHRIYLSLHSVIATVNNSFGVKIMLAITSCATATALKIHTFIVFLAKSLGLLTLNLAWRIPAILWLIIIAASCEMSKNEDGRTAVLVQKILLH